MSDQNAEVVRRLVGAFNRRTQAAMTKWFAPEVEWEPGGPAAVERSLYRGRDESPARLLRLGSHRGCLPRGGERGSRTWMTRLCGWKRPIEEDASQVDFNQPLPSTSWCEAARSSDSRGFVTWQGALEAAGLQE